MLHPIEDPDRDSILRRGYSISLAVDLGRWHWRPRVRCSHGSVRVRLGWFTLSVGRFWYLGDYE